MEAIDDQTGQVPALWPWLLLCAVGGVWVTLGTPQLPQHADSLVPVLASLYRWTPYFWELDRIGMLVPLLARPFHDPFTNLLVQNVLDNFAGLAAMVLLARYVLRDGTYPLVGVLSAAVFLTLAPLGYRFHFYVSTLYGVWLALGLGGLILAESSAKGWWRRALGFLLMVLAHWAFSAALVVLGPLVLLRALFFKGEQQQVAAPQSPAGTAALPTRLCTHLYRLAKTETAVNLLLLASAFAVGWLSMRRTKFHTNMETLPVREWWGGVRLLAHNTWNALQPHGWPCFLLLTAWLGLTLLSLPRLRRHGTRALRAAGTLAASAPFFGLFMATTKHFKMNDYDQRYSLSCVFLAQEACMVLGVAGLAALLSRRVRVAVHVLLVPVFLLALHASCGVPSLAAFRADLDQTLGRYTADVLDAHCTHVAGDYWKVWPTVFHANLVLHERGQPDQVWGLTYRSGPTASQWRQVPRDKVRVAVPVGDPEAETWLRRSGFGPMLVAEKRATVWVLRPDPTAISLGAAAGGGAVQGYSSLPCEWTRYSGRTSD
jgi:hypothetical protein